MLHLNDLTMNKEFISLSFHVLKTFNAIKRGTFNKEQIKAFDNIYFLLRLLISGKVVFLRLCLHTIG
ncbi:hypothetical protein M33023_03880 [Candidatus Phytoplasma asteris]|uniref:Uncharacterized protein n=1 Tax=Candidatus Phytoplasma asteris TaxID=85620 RepID=A0ABZ2YFL4_9MOLU